MAKVLLNIFYIFRPFFKRSGVDFDKMMLIAETKIKMDGRRVYMNWRSQQQKNENNRLTFVLLFYGFIGFVTGLVIFFTDNFFTVMVIMHAYILFMMCMTLVTDFSAVLLDTTDNQVILPKPVNSKTLFNARMLHILIYLLQFTIAMAAGSWLFTFIKYGLLTGIAFMLTTILTVLLAVFITWFLYLAILRFSSEQKMRDIITYFQIFMTILFTAGFQIFPRLVDLTDMREILQLRWYSYLLPPVWMASTVEAIHLKLFDMLHIGMILLSLFVPLAGFRLLNRYLAPAFSRKLLAMQGNSAQSVQPSQALKGGKDGWAGRAGTIFSRSVPEKAFFMLTWRITSRDRNFRMQFYPGLAYIAVIFFVFVLRGKRSMEENLTDLPGSSKYLWLVYSPLLISSSAMTLIAFNENFNASWIYHTAPVQRPGEMITGAMKAIFIKYFLPVYLILFAIAFYIWGSGITDDFIFGFFNNLLSLLMVIALTDHYLPFSRQPSAKQSAGKFASTLIQFIVIGVLVGLHYMLIRYPYILLGIIPVTGISIYLLLKHIRNIGWNKIAV